MRKYFDIRIPFFVWYNKDRYDISTDSFVEGWQYYGFFIKFFKRAPKTFKLSFSIGWANLGQQVKNA